MAQSRPSKFIRSQIGPSRLSAPASLRLESHKSGRLIQPDSLPSFSMTMSVIDGLLSMSACRRTEDGNEDLIVSPTFVENDFVKGIEKTDIFDEITVQIALEKDENAQSFSFPRSWTPLNSLASDCRAVGFEQCLVLVADEELTAKDHFVRLSVLKRLGVDTNTLFEQKMLR